MNSDTLPPLATDATAIVSSAVKAAGTEAVSDSEASRAEVIYYNDTSPIRVTFTLQYTDLGLDRLYGELAALSSDLERTKHIKRCLHDIVRGDFKRPAAARHVFGDHDRESFKVQIRFSSRDVGLEAVFNELKPILTTFKRNNVLRQKLYDAFTLPFAPSPCSTALTAHPQPLSTATVLLSDPTGIQSRPHALAAMVPATLIDQSKVGERRNAARQANAGQFGLS